MEYKFCWIEEASIFPNFDTFKSFKIILYSKPAESAELWCIVISPQFY